MNRLHLEDMVESVEPARAARWLVWILLGITIVAIAWAAFTQIDRTVRGVGRVVPSSRLQIVSTLDSGIIEEILVRAGMVVVANQPLIRLDPTERSAEFGSGEATTTALRVKVARLQAELLGRAPAYPSARDPDLMMQIAIEQQLHSARMTELATTQSAARARITQAERSVEEAQAAYGAAIAARQAAREEEAIVRPLVERGIEPRLTLVQAQSRASAAASQAEGTMQTIARARATVVEARASLSRVLQDWRTGTANDLAAAQAELSARASTIPALERRVARTLLRSPVAGRVNRVLVTTAGSAITAGQPLVEIVPTGGGLAIDARVNAQDIGSVRINQRARIAITAYEQSVHGTLEGRVITISPDSIIDEQSGSVYYEVRVVTDRATLESPTGQRLTIEPGMVAEVSLLGEKRSVLSYILSPITRLGERAFRE